MNRFRGRGPGAASESLLDILSDPTQGSFFPAYYDVLRGVRDSDLDNLDLLVGTNARTYLSQGVLYYRIVVVSVTAKRNKSSSYFTCSTRYTKYSVLPCHAKERYR